MDVSKNVNSISSGADFSYSGSSWSSTGFFISGLYSNDEIFQRIGLVSVYANENNLVFFKHKGSSLNEFKKTAGTATGVEVVVTHIATVGGATTILSRFLIGLDSNKPIQFNHSFLVPANLGAGNVNLYITANGGTLTIQTGTITGQRISL